MAGYGMTGDAYHITQPAPEGEGAQRSMRRALKDAGITPDDVQYINAHGTSTPFNDQNETLAIKAVFGDQGGVAVTSTKSATGHLLGAAGGIEAIFTALAIRDQIAPMTLNLEKPDEAAAGIDIVHGKARPMKIDYALSNGFGFGGVNASVLFRRFEV